MTTSYSLIIWRLWVRRIPSEAIPFRNNQELGISSMKKVNLFYYLQIIKIALCLI